MNPFRRTAYRTERRDYASHNGYGNRADPYVEGGSHRRRQHRFNFGRRTREAHNDRVAAGYKAALTNPNTTRRGREHAKHELERMGRGREAHVPLMTRVKRALGIRSTPRQQRRAEYGRRRY